MLERFRIMLEAAEDQGQEVEPPNFSSEPDGEQLILDAIRDANTDPVEESSDDDSDSDTGDIGAGGTAGTPAQAPEPEELILGRFKTQDDLAEAYRNLEPAYTQTSQQMRELERQVQYLQEQMQGQQPADDFAFDTTGTAFTTNPTNIEELEALAAEHPDQAALWAVQHSERLPAELVQETMNYWHSRNPAQATAYMLHSMFQSYLPQVEQRIAPGENRYQEEVVNNAVDMAETAIGPQYAEYHDRIIDMIEANPTLLPDDLTNAQAMSESIINVYAMLLGHDLLQRGQQLAQGQAVDPTPAAQAARTATRTGAVVPQPEGEAATQQLDQQIQDMILRAR